MPRSASKPRTTLKPRFEVNRRRLYVDSRYGQLHVHSAFPSSGGFDEETTLIAVHDQGETGRSLDAFIDELGHDRSVYAPDLPGCGESDPLGKVIGATAECAALCDFLDQMRFRQVDVFGIGAGAKVAAEFALARAEKVRRVIVAGATADIAKRLEGHAPVAEVVPEDKGRRLADLVRTKL
jgi:pimeloyl-ACP methyl ester carboxylesterase